MLSSESAKLSTSLTQDVDDFMPKLSKEKRDRKNFLTNQRQNFLSQRQNLLMSLISNLDKDHLLVHNILFYSYFEIPQLNKKIYFFGEEHTSLLYHNIDNDWFGFKTNDEVSIPVYVKSLPEIKSLNLITWIELYRIFLSHQNKCLNLFLELGSQETWMHKPKLLPDPSALKLIKFYYGNKTLLSTKPIEQTKLLTTMKNLKVHYMDLRDTYSGKGVRQNEIILNPVDAIVQMSDILEVITNLLAEKIPVSEFLEIFRVKSSVSSPSYYYISSEIILLKIIKQFKKSLFYNDIQKFYECLVILLIEQKYPDHSYHFMIDLLSNNDFYWKSFVIQNILTDIFTLSRFFVVESHVKNTGILRENLIDDCLTDLNDNIVFIGGAAHSIFYTDFIKIYFDINPVEEKHNDIYNNSIVVLNPGFNTDNLSISQRNNILEENLV